VTKPTPNFIRLDSGRPQIAILVDAMLRAREVVAARPWSLSQEPTSEYWWADVLADPRARIRRQPHGYDRDDRQMSQRAFYTALGRLSRSHWKTTFSRAELLALYGPDYPLPTLLDHLAMPGCSRLKSQWDRCGVRYVNPIDRREQSSS
jgi:hypothetical protein